MRTVRMLGIAVAVATLAPVVADGANLSQEPASFTVARSDLTNQYAVLSWTLPADITNTVVYRAYGEGGPWTEIAETNDCATTWTDKTAPLGVPCWYKIAFAERDEEGVRTVGDMCSAVVSHRRCQLLERDWSDMTHVKDGVTVIWHAGTKIYNNGDGKTRTTVEESAADAFDNNLKTHPNVSAPSSGRQSIGVDLNSAYGIGFVRCYRRSGNASSQYYLNVNGMVIYGSNSDSSWYANTEPTVTEPVAVSTTLTWYETASTNFTPYRYVYACNPNRSWSLTVTELQFYGWPATATDGYAIGAVDLSAVQSGSSVVLSWKDNGYGTVFNVERSINDGEWTTVASGLSATTYEDSDVVLDGTAYRYRIASVCGGAVSYSAAVRCVPYVHGDGVGLHRSALFPFIATEATDMTEYVSTGAVEIAAATFAEARPLIEGVAESYTNVYVTWTGKLVVPFAGSYTFRAVADGMVSVWVDDVSVCRYSTGAALDSVNGGAMSEIVSSARSLAAGEHDIRVAYWQGADSSGCELYWGGSVCDELIPVSQLKPDVPNVRPELWDGGRLFMHDADSCCPGDIRFNDDGTVDMAFAGADGRTATCAYNFLWRGFTGDFTMTARIDYRLSSKQSGEKAGLVVMADTSSTSPFEMFLMRSNAYDFGLRSRRTVGGNPSEPLTVEALGSKAVWNVSNGSKTVYMRLRREGSTFTYSYRKTKSEAWTTIYEYADTKGLYGKTVYIGPVATNVTLGKPGWTGASYRAARYAWRFSEIEVREHVGSRLIVR